MENETSKGFNLVTERWIKVCGSEELSLQGFFSSTEPPRLGGTAVQKLIVFKLLLAIAYAACRLEDEDDYEDLSVDELKSACIKYLLEHKDRFDLWSKEYPFLQHPGMPVGFKKTYPIAAFIPGVCIGNTTLLNDANILPEKVDSKEIAYALLQLVTYGMGGKKAAKEIVFAKGLTKKSAAPSPSLGRGWLHTFPLGEDIFSTIKLNLFSKEILEEEQISFLSEGVGIPPWEKMPLLEKGPEAEKYMHSLMGWLLPVSRFCLLDGLNVILTSGIEYPKIDTGICEFSISTVMLGTGKNQYVSAVRSRIAQEPWRQLDAILAFWGGQQAQGCRGLKIVANHRREDMKGIWCLGMQVTEQSGEQYMSGTDDFIEGRYEVLPEWVGEQFLSDYIEEMKEVDRVRKVIYACVCGYYTELGGAPDLGKSFAARAQEIFFEKCSAIGNDFIQSCGKGSPKAYRNRFYRNAREAFNLVCPASSARQLIAYEKNVPFFSFIKEE